MYIEDLINRLASSGQYLFADPIKVLASDYQVISSLSSQIVMGNGFTEKQSHLALRLVKKYTRFLSVALNVDILPFVTTPQYKLPIRVLNSNKTIVIKKVTDTNKRVISLTFPYDENLINRIKEYKRECQRNSSNFSTINWNMETRSWDFDLREDHVDWISQNLLDSSFLADETFQDIVKQIEEVKNTLEKYVPMVVFENNKFIFKNIPSSVPQPEKFDLVNTLVEGKKYGITTWGEDIDIALRELNLNPLLYKFLTSPDATTLSGIGQKMSISDACDIAMLSLPALVIVPGGTELRHLEACTKIFNERGISNEEMTVLFRLDKETGKNFNNFVKENKLNNPISEKMKIAFISGKVPKPLIESKINFLSILNLGISGVHYTLSNYIKNHHFVINCSLKDSDFAEL